MKMQGMEPNHKLILLHGQVFKFENCIDQLKYFVNLYINQTENDINSLPFHRSYYQVHHN